MSYPTTEACVVFMRYARRLHYAAFLAQKNGDHRLAKQMQRTSAAQYAWVRWLRDPSWETECDCEHYLTLSNALLPPLVYQL